MDLFTHGKSCLAYLLETFEDITKSVDEGVGVDMIYLDYSKAFDSVPHRRLLQKLAGHGIRGRLPEWISDFLEGRKQRVCVRGKTSEWSDVRSGVPQGSVLGPLCFLCMKLILMQRLNQWFKCLLMIPRYIGEHSVSQIE